jgi:hypothetical protein
MSDQEFNDLLSNLAAKIPTQCDAYESIRKQSETPQNLPGSRLYNLNDFEAYRNDIEFVNSFPKQVLIDEEKYFVKKYSTAVYQALLNTRDTHMNSIEKAITDKLCEGKAGTKCVIDETMCKSDSCKVFLPDAPQKNEYVKELLKQNPLERPATLHKKVEYRKDAHGLLSSINGWMTFLYFGLLVGMILVFLIQGELHLRERFLVYLGLAVLPFLFPYLFELLAYLYLGVFPENKIQGPKNAFVEVPVTVESYNM